MNVFAQRLKELRSEKGLSTMVLGKLIGVSDMSICRWENNKNDIKAEQLVAVAKFFDVSADYLLGLRDDF
jgi:transcriptional regulator with XRE-family HTH domain